MEPTVPGKPVDVMFPPHLQADIPASLKSVGMKVEDFVDNVQR